MNALRGGESEEILEPRSTKNDKGSGETDGSCRYPPLTKALTHNHQAKKAGGDGKGQGNRHRSSPFPKR